MTEKNEIKNVPMLISNVMKDLSEVGISKSQLNKFDNYKFRGIDDVYNTLSKFLAKYNLVIVPSIKDRENSVVSTAKGGSMNHTILTVEYTFRSPYTEDIIVCSVMGEAMDRGDKSINKAFSAAYKYLCLQVFCIPLQGDNDADSESHEMVNTVINEVQLGVLNILIGERVVDVPALLAHYKIEKLEELPSGVFLQAKGALERKPMKQDENA